MGDLTFEWPNLTTIGIVATIRKEGGKTFNGEQLELRFYISSRKLTAKELLESRALVNRSVIALPIRYRDAER